MVTFFLDWSLDLHCILNTLEYQVFLILTS